jgi:hypothetical protein
MYLTPSIYTIICISITLSSKWPLNVSLSQQENVLISWQWATIYLKTGLSPAYLKTMGAAIKRSRAASAITVVKDNTRVSFIYSKH